MINTQYSAAKQFTPAKNQNAKKEPSFGCPADFFIPEFVLGTVLGGALGGTLNTCRHFRPQSKHDIRDDLRKIEKLPLLGEKTATFTRGAMLATQPRYWRTGRGQDFVKAKRKEIVDTTVDTIVAAPQKTRNFVASDRCPSIKRQQEAAKNVRNGTAIGKQQPIFPVDRWAADRWRDTRNFVASDRCPSIERQKEAAKNVRRELGI